MNRKQDDWNPMANDCQAQVAIGLAYGYRDEDYFRLKILTCMLEKL